LVAEFCEEVAEYGPVSVKWCAKSGGSASYHSKADDRWESLAEQPREHIVLFRGYECAVLPGIARRKNIASECEFERSLQCSLEPVEIKMDAIRHYREG
jgi:hypothetical protein